MVFRLIYNSFLFVVFISFAVSCGDKGATTNRDGDVIDLDQNVTNDFKPKDSIFIDFEKNWRKFVSDVRVFTLPVIMPQEAERRWEPIVLSECVYSPDAGGYVPQVTLVWNEDPVQSPPSPSIQSGRKQQAQNNADSVSVGQYNQGDTVGLRFDLAVHYQGFERNYYTTALSVQKLKRFNLPSNSALVKDTEAVLLTGPSIFPKLMDFKMENIRDRDSNRALVRRTLVLRDLSPGLSYTIRQCLLTGEEWEEDRKFVFSTPVCPNSF